MTLESRCILCGITEKKKTYKEPIATNKSTCRGQIQAVEILFVL